MTCGKGTETGDLVCPSASHPRVTSSPSAVGAGASVIPIWRVIQIDPVMSLRAE